VEECGPCLVFARYTLAFALQLRIKHYWTLNKAEYTVPRAGIFTAGKKPLVNFKEGGGVWTPEEGKIFGYEKNYI